MPLLNTLASDEVLDRAFFRCRMSARCHKPTLLQYYAMWREWETCRGNLSRALIDETYEFEGYTAMLGKPKKSGQPRPLSRTGLLDRIVQEALQIVLKSAIGNSVASPCSFGRAKAPGEEPRSIRTLVKKLVEVRKSGSPWVYESDIRSFFDEVNHTVLLSKLSRLLRPDTSLIPLLDNFICNRIINDQEPRIKPHLALWNPDLGVPQGGVLSPLLASIYLADFDRDIVADGFQLFRYVDDFVILCADRESAIKAEVAVLASLSKLHLRAYELAEPETKARISAPHRAFSFVGLKFYPGGNVRPDTKRLEDLDDRIRALTESNDERSLVEVIISVENLLSGWFGAYGPVCRFGDAELEKWDQKIGHYVGVWCENAGIMKRGKVLQAETMRQKLGLTPVASLARPRSLTSQEPEQIGHFDLMDPEDIVTFAPSKTR